MDTGKNIEKCKICQKNIEISLEIVHNIQTPIMCNSCHVLCSLSESEQHSVIDNKTSSTNEFSSQDTKDKFSLLASSESLESDLKISSTNNNNNTQEFEKEMHSNISVSRKKFNVLEKIPTLNDNSFDADFKNPYFLKHTFEDETILDESKLYEDSSNLLSTSASSLSSLTIDDDNCNDNMKPNKAGLIKTKLNSMNLSQVQEESIQENWRLDPIGSSCESSQIFKLINSKQIVYNLSDKLLRNSLLNQEITNHQSNIYQCKDFCQHQKYDKKRTIETGYTINDMNKSNWNLTANQYMENVQSIRSEAEGRTEESNFRNKLQTKNICKDKSNDIYQKNQVFINCHKTELNFVDKYDKCIKHNRCTEHEFLEKNRFSHEFYPSHNTINHSFEGSNELNAYEEQLLDQCIRRGMAKVTKRNISDIKPFCWDLKQICLTTRAMLKTHDENIAREKQEFNKRNILHRGLMRHTSNSCTK